MTDITLLLEVRKNIGNDPGWNQGDWERCFAGHTLLARGINPVDEPNIPGRAKELLGLTDECFIVRRAEEAPQCCNECEEQFMRQRIPAYQALFHTPTRLDAIDEVIQQIIDHEKSLTPA